MFVARKAYLKRYEYLEGTDALGILQRWCCKAVYKVSYHDSIRVRWLDVGCGEQPGGAATTITIVTISSSTTQPYPAPLTSMQPPRTPTRAPKIRQRKKSARWKRCVVKLQGSARGWLARRHIARERAQQVTDLAHIFCCRCWHTRCAVFLVTWRRARLRLRRNQIGF